MSFLHSFISCYCTLLHHIDRLLHIERRQEITHCEFQMIMQTHFRSLSWLADTLVAFQNGYFRDALYSLPSHMDGKYDRSRSQQNPSLCTPLRILLRIFLCCFGRADCSGALLPGSGSTKY